MMQSDRVVSDSTDPIVYRTPRLTCTLIILAIMLTKCIYKGQIRFLLKRLTNNEQTGNVCFHTETGPVSNVAAQ